MYLVLIATDVSLFEVTMITLKQLASHAIEMVGILYI